MATFLLSALLGYLLGSVPFGLVLTRLAGLGDIRQIGSGNIGATNVLRTGNKPLALATLLLDSGKGAIAALLALWWAGPEAAVFAAGGAMLGHTFPVWLRFNGGKGVATAIGVLLAVCWPAGLLACLTWLLTAALFRISSLSALVAVALSPLTGWYFGGPLVGGLCLFIAVLVFIRHEANIRRLLKGEEPKIGAGKKKAA
ncbi:glycerol-3-phosphate 1-O-acyltransferase PlsY [Azospirillum picis]|uniref:Glycerol-3-phosphate acyltransferase n=1 Tax=Azospirillum picis TaxID=488438 RepID=A0ABU0MGJ9_9PROT|nr:glycerol-3-phosphate 1-O-acyltransferase PlsY [Azospirillum picis]MBP2298389.1 glycerol-3-phosphate acyltransferase PlsY [Azospirillum picis]MDQ0532562.1 glycerol-3-phosphate acyltransferase PlsY [Azospirillum picis]